MPRQRSAKPDLHTWTTCRGKQVQGFELLGKRYQEKSLHIRYEYNLNCYIYPFCGLKGMCVESADNLGNWFSPTTWLSEPNSGGQAWQWAALFTLSVMDRGEAPRLHGHELPLCMGLEHVRTLVPVGTMEPGPLGQPGVSDPLSQCMENNLRLKGTKQPAPDPHRAWNWNPLPPPIPTPYPQL